MDMPSPVLEPDVGEMAAAANEQATKTSIRIMHTSL